MATTTTNYNLTKPTMAEIADIRTLNNNMDKVDEVMHSTQVSLAPAYDLLETYNTGDIVMYELLMYKCKEDNVTGAWNPAKWERTTAGENGSGGGGSSVVPNPQGSPTDTLETIEIDGTVYDIAGSGGGGGSEPIKIESIWQGTANQTGVDYTTNKSIEDYDYLIFKFRPADLVSGTDETEPFIRDVNDLTDYGTDTFACIYFQNAYVRGAFSDDTTFSLSIISSQGSTVIALYEIQGVKLTGGAGDASEIIPITAGDGTTSRTFTFDKIPKKISMQYVANGWGFYRDIIWGTDRSYYQASQATISESATYIGVSGIVCDEATKSITITGLNAIQASNTTDIVGYMYVEYGGAGGSGGGASEYIPYSNKNNIVCEATLNNFDASSLEWGDGESPIILSQTVSMYNNEAVSIPVNTSGVIAYSDVGGNKQPFTAYMVCKAQTSGNYTRLLSALESHATNMGAMIFGTNNINMGSWNDSTPTGLSATSDYIVCAIQYTGYGLGYCKVNNIDLSPFPLIGSNRYITIGRTDGGSGGDQDPCDILVKYFGVVEGTDTHKAINENVAYLMDKFGIN